DEANLPTGSLLTAMTMGIVVVACWAARIASSPSVTMMSTWRRISSATSAGSRSYCPSAKRDSMVMFRPSTYPRSRSPCRKASMRGAKAEEEPGMSSPSRGTFAACCAEDVSGAVSRLRMSVTIHPMVLPHIVISSRQPHADLLLSMEAAQLLERQRRRNIQYLDMTPAMATAYGAFVHRKTTGCREDSPCS